MTIGPAYGGADVTVLNPRDVLYVDGDAFTDGSVRLIMGDDGVPQIERRVNGVWNLGELNLGRGSLLLGRKVRVSAAGHHLIVEAPIDNQQSIVVGSFYDDSGSIQPHATLLDPRINRAVVQADNSLEQTLMSHTGSQVSTASAIFFKGYLQTGAVGASADVNIVFSEGIPPNDNIFFNRNYPSSVWPANTEVVLEVSPGLIFPGNTQINVNITSENAFTMKYNATGMMFFLAVDLQLERDEFILTFPTGFNRLLSDRSGNMMTDKSGNVMALRVS